MATRRRTVQHLWNRFMAAVLFALGAALSTAAPTETRETSVSRAEATQLDTTAYVGRQLSAALATKLDGSGDGDRDDQPAFAPAVFTFADREAGTAWLIASQPSPAAKRLARDGESRAPPSA
jgi:hypothetical protein